MGLRDELRESLRSARSAGATFVRQSRGVMDDYVESVQTDSRMRDLDQRLAKAAQEAEADGNDGNHVIVPTKDDGKHNPVRDPKALHFDPFDIVAMMGWRERPTSLAYGAMEGIGNGVPVIADIIRVRTTQVCAFTTRPDGRHSPGFKVRLRDQNATPTAATEKRAQELEDNLLNTGYFDPEKPQDAISLTTFAKMFVRDTLVFDQACFEVVPDRKGRPSYFVMVDPSTIRLLDPMLREDGDPFAVQVINGSLVSDFTQDELAFCVRNPRSGIRSWGYGMSEIETLVREITGFLWGIEYNRRFFSQGSTTKGILNFKGTIPDKHLRAFRRQWYAMVSGVHNAWRTPITNAEELQWINLQMSNRDMEYGSWMDFLIKVCCARFQIAPEEVNFSYGNTGQAAAMGGTSTEEKLKASKDLGLRPLVQFFFNCMNQYYLQRIDPDFEAVPVGLDDRGPDAEAELLQKQTHVFLTVDEAREHVGLEPLADGKGECLLDPTWLQWAQAKEFADQEGGPGGDPFGGDDEERDGSTFGIEDEDGNDMEADDESGDGDDDGDGADKAAEKLPQVAKSDRTGVELASPQVVRYNLDL